MIRNFWDGYKDDENIRTAPLASATSTSSRRYIWVRDTTPQTNHTSHLLSIDDTGRACVILYVPLSSSVSLETDAKGLLPPRAKSLDTPPPNFPATEITYTRGRDGVYWPTTCRHVGAGIREQKVSCETVFSDR